MTLTVDSIHYLELLNLVKNLSNNYNDINQSSGSRVSCIKILAAQRFEYTAW